MQPLDRDGNKHEQIALFPKDASWRRVIVLQRWRRITNAVCLFLAAYALVVTELYPPAHHPGTTRLDESLLILIVAFLVAANILTVAFGNRRSRE
jgi:ABC-type polysaccharide transport system permease subunit